MSSAASFLTGVNWCLVDSVPLWQCLCQNLTGTMSSHRLKSTCHGLQVKSGSADKRTKPEASAKEARQWIDSWRGKDDKDSPSPKQVDKAKEAVSKEKSKESANI